MNTLALSQPVGSSIRFASFAEAAQEHRRTIVEGFETSPLYAQHRITASELICNSDIDLPRRGFAVINDTRTKAIFFTLDPSRGIGHISFTFLTKQEDDSFDRVHVVGVPQQEALFPFTQDVQLVHGCWMSVVSKSNFTAGTCVAQRDFMLRFLLQGLVA